MAILIDISKSISLFTPFKFVMLTFSRMVPPWEKYLTAASTKRKNTLMCAMKESASTGKSPCEPETLNSEGGAPPRNMKGGTFNFVYDTRTKEVRSLRRLEMPERSLGSNEEVVRKETDISRTREAIESALQAAIIDWLPDRQSRAGLQISLIGIHSVR
jgi:hypothetical protein